jgi:hypothetical protein
MYSRQSRIGEAITTLLDAARSGAHMADCITALYALEQGLTAPITEFLDRHGLLGEDGLATLADLLARDGRHDESIRCLDHLLSRLERKPSANWRLLCQAVSSVADHLVKIGSG